MEFFQKRTFGYSGRFTYVEWLGLEDDAHLIYEMRHAHNGFNKYKLRISQQSFIDKLIAMKTVYKWVVLNEAANRPNMTPCS